MSLISSPPPTGTRRTQGGKGMLQCGFSKALLDKSMHRTGISHTLIYRQEVGAHLHTHKLTVALPRSSFPCVHQASRRLHLFMRGLMCLCAFSRQGTKQVYRPFAKLDDSQMFLPALWTSAQPKILATTRAVSSGKRSPVVWSFVSTLLVNSVYVRACVLGDLRGQTATAVNCICQGRTRPD